ncbi:MAG: helix-turn-helix domain-containing protein [Sneathiellales bacterium]|nr:helix-turn-helix domain-containing protein [Sneathiellales bacterium]
MTIKDRRLQKAWSQEYLAQVSGLSVRTIQRVESGHKAGLDTLQSLAAAFDIDVAELQEEGTMIKENAKADTASVHESERSHLQTEYIHNIKGFHMNWVTFMVVIPCLFALDHFVTPGPYWVQWVIGSWGGAIILHAILLYFYFGVFGKEWEKKALKRLEK